MLSAGIGIAAALAFVLGLIALSVWALKRVGGASLSNRSRLPVEVVQRISLGPKSGLAIVRVGEKVMAVSMGDGGVHTLFEVDEADRRRIVAGSEVATPLLSSAAAQQAFARAGAKAGAGALTNAFSGSLMRAFAAGRSAGAIAMPSARTPDSAHMMNDAPAFRPFGHALTNALRSESEQTPIAALIGRRAEPVRASDLQRVLSMTLAPSTRLLSIIAFAVLGVLGAGNAVEAQDPVPPTVVNAPGAVAAPSPIELPTITPLVLPPVPTQAASRPATTGSANTAQRTGARAGAGNAATQTAASNAANAARPAASQSTAGNSAGTSASTSADVQAAEPSSVAEAVGGMVPQLDLSIGSGPDSELRLNGTVGVVLMMGLMTLVPTLLLMMTGFTRILIVLHFLKQAMGTQSAPPAHLVAGLALLLTGFVMAPTITEANRTAITPWLEGRMEQTEMLKTGVVPFREFMLRQTNEKDLTTFVNMSGIVQPETPDDVPLHVLMSAFVASELRTAFQIGFAIYLPFIVIDAVVASVLMAMGMFMLPPAMISLPFKLLLFVLVDGWSLTIQSLVQSFR